MGQVIPLNDFLARPTTVVYYVTWVCETFGDFKKSVTLVLLTAAPQQLLLATLLNTQSMQEWKSDVARTHTYVLPMKKQGRNGNASQHITALSVTE